MMNYTEIEEEYDAESPHLTPEIEEYLEVTAKWAKIISIIGFVLVGFMLLGSFSLMAMAPLLEEMSEMPFPTTYLVLIYVAFAFIPIFPLVYLYRFASNMQVALKYDTPNRLAKSFGNLKSHYKSIGVLTLAMMGLYFVAIFAFVYFSVAGN